MSETPKGLYAVLPTSWLIKAEKARAKTAHEADVDTAKRLNLTGNKRSDFFRVRNLEEAGRMLRLQAVIARRGF